MAVVLDQAPGRRRAIDIVLRRIGLLHLEPDTGPIRVRPITAENL